MSHLTDVTVESVTFGKSGNTNNVDWTIHNVTIDGKKMGYFGQAKEPLHEGQLLSFLEYDETQNGKYTNLSIKSFVPADNQPAPKVQQSTQTSAPAGSVNNDVEMSFILGNVARIIAIHPTFAKVTKENMPAAIALTAIKVRDILRGSKPEEPKKEVNEPPETGGQGGFDASPPEDDIPF